MTEVRDQKSEVGDRGETPITDSEWHMVKPISDLRYLISVLCTFLLALCSSAQAQQPKKIPLIGYLSSGDATSESTRFEGIRLALRERG